MAADAMEKGQEQLLKLEFKTKELDTAHKTIGKCTHILMHFCSMLEGGSVPLIRSADLCAKCDKTVMAWPKPRVRWIRVGGNMPVIIRLWLKGDIRALAVFFLQKCREVINL